MHVTDREPAEQRLHAQYAVSRILAEASSLAEATPKILQAIGEAVDWKVGAIWRVSPTKEHLYCVEVWHSASTHVPKFLDATRDTKFPMGTGLPGRVWQLAAPAWIADVTEDGNFPRAPIALKEGLRGAFGFPVRLGEDILGVIEFFSTEVRPPDQALLQMMDAAGQQIGQFIERRRMERELEQRTEELTSFVETGAIGLHWVGPDGIIQWANETELQILGYAREEYIGHHIAEFHLDQKVIADILARLSRGEKIRDCEARMKCRDGSAKMVLIDSSVFWDEGRFIHTQCMIRDITGRKQADEDRAHLAAIIESSDDAIISKDLYGLIQSWNRGAERIFGYAAHQIVGRPLSILIPPSRFKEEDEILARLRRGERVEHFETVRRRKDNSPVDVSLTVSPIKDGTGRVIGVSHIARDISGRKAVERALQRSEALLRQLADAMPQIVWAAAADGTADYFNHRWYELTGAKEGQTGDQSFVPFLHPDDRTRCLEKWYHSVRTGEPYEIEYRFNLPLAGGYRWLLGRALPVRDSAGNIIRWFGTCTDIDDQKQSQSRIVRLNETLLAVLESIPDIVFVTDGDGKIEFRNPACDRFLAAIGSEDLPVAIRAELKQVLQTGKDQLPTDFKKVHRFGVNNAERFFLSRIVSIRPSDGRAVGAVAMLQDVTEFRLLDEVKTNLIATVSHELKTPIAGVLTALMVLLEQHWGPLNAKQKELLSIARHDGERLLRTLTSLLDLTRFEDSILGLRLENLQPEELVRAAVQDTHAIAMDAAVTVTAEMVSLPLLEADRERVSHALTNLLTNAIKYSPRGGKIVVQARQQEENIYFSVTDQGPGVPEVYQARIFEKSFRVPSRPTPGAGLGLWIAREFVQSHGGKIGVRNLPGGGSEFFFSLPIKRS